MGSGGTGVTEGGAEQQEIIEEEQEGRDDFY